MDIKQENYNKFLQSLIEHKEEVNYNPLSIMVGLTNVCNLHCAFCPYCGFCYKKIKEPQYLSLDVLDTIRPLFTTALFFSPSTRGEPFLYPYFKEFISLCRETNILAATHLINNGTQLDKFDLKTLDGIGTIAISFDSADKKVFEILRYGASYEHVIKNIRKLRIALPNTNLQMCVVVNRLNIWHLLDIFKFAKEFCFNVIQFNNIFGEEQDKVYQLLRLRRQDQIIYEEQMAIIDSLNKDSNITIYKTAGFDEFDDEVPIVEEKIYNQLLNLRSMDAYLDYDNSQVNKFSASLKIQDKQYALSEKRLPYCTSPWTTLIILPNGDICPCCNVFSAIDNINGKTAEKVWNGEPFQKFRKSMFNYGMIPDYCLKCKSFMRYDFVDDYAKNIVDLDDLQIPPHYFPPEYSIKHPRLKARIDSINCQRKKNMINENYNSLQPAKAVNSKEYWEARFSTGDWNKFDGDKQSEFFSKIAIDTFPEWLKADLNRNEWRILDVGCAQGDGSAVLARNFPSCRVTGMDFAESAIKDAESRFPYCDFIVGDATESLQQFDVIFSSNTLEHLKNPRSVMEIICNAASKYAIFLLPFEDSSDISEHFHVFGRGFFPLQLGNCFLKYYTVIDCSFMNPLYWSGKQILLIYVNSAYQTPEALTVETIYQNYTRIPEQEALCVGNQVKTQKEKLEENAKIISELETLKTHLENENAVLETKKAILENENAALQNEKVALESYEDILENEKAALKNQKVLMEAQKFKIEKERDNYKEQNGGLCTLIEKVEAELLEQTENLQKVKKSIQQARELCYSLVGTRLFKLVHFVSRFKRQGMSKTKEERKNFFKWFFGRFQHASDGDHRFNPIFGIISILDNALSVNNVEKGSSYVDKKQNDKSKNYEIYGSGIGRSNNSILQENNHSKLRQSILSYTYKKCDVIMLGIIDYDFRYQRPQHFADRFAQNGHRVFYVNANHFPEYSVKEEKENLYVIDFKNKNFSAIHLTDWSQNIEALKQSFDELLYEYCIRDAIVVIDYPNWVHGAEYLREHYGFKLITDYMDDFTGFLNPTGKLVGENCKELLKKSDLVIASSQFLFEIASKYNKNVEIVRNGGEYEHFHKAYRQKTYADKKIIGYYGAIAHWFDVEKVCYVAKHLPECTIILIGEVTEGRTQFEEYSNIRLIGELPYSELPDYLKTFDVCMIPFDTKTDLIKATNPVKFYEYLSAGKKVVATEIPELMPFKDKYVYLTNDNEEFLKNIQLCLDGNDVLTPPEKSAIFGKENDWQDRYDIFSQLCKRAIPEVSVIVLTYNNLAYNRQCIQSIFEKTAYPNFNVIIVDNQSTDGTRDYLQELDAKRIQNLQIIFNEENKGFAAGNNIGIHVARGDYVLLLNNDTIVTRGWITSMVKHMENDNTIGMCGSVTNSIGNEAQVMVKYHDIEGLDEFSYNYTWKHMNEQWQDPNVLAFFCTLIKRGVIEKCGLLDESYKVGMFEDDDYAEEVKSAGYRLAIAEDSFVHHFGGSSFKRLKDKKYKEIFETNKKTFEGKWLKKWKPHAYRPGVTWEKNKNTSLEIG
ncbi:MAG TPA: hypothetical protein DD738_09165 [Ruminiclostridium sp.]|nr:hypothetical protein [Ruminiclostridium sp.]